MRKLLILFSLPLILFFSCSKQETHPKKLTLLLDWWPNPNHVAIYAGLKKGIFEKHGIELEILNLQDPPDALVYLLAESCDVSLYYLPLCLKAYEKNQDFQVIGKLVDEPLYTLMSRRETQIHTQKDFDGKSLGHFGNTLSKAIKNAIEKNNDIQFSDFKTFSFDPAAALYTKTLDVICDVYWNVEMCQLEEKGIDVTCFNWEDLGFPRYPELVFIAKNSYVDQNMKKLQSFQKAIDESIVFAVDHEEEAFELYQSSFKEGKKAWERKSWSLTRPLLAKSQKISDRELVPLINWLKEHEVIESGCDYTLLFKP